MSDELVGSMVVISGPEKGRSFSIATGVCVVGRGRDSDTQIRDPKISRIHCEIRALQGRLELVHRGGSGGTLVDGVAIKGSVQLSTGSVLQLGDTILRIDSADPLDAATVASNQTALPASSCAEADNVAEAGVVPFDVVTPTGKAGAPSIRLEALVGEKINDFRLDRVASVGRNSVVFKAHDVENDAPVAMKILKPQLTSTDVQRERFIRAMQTMKQVRHQNIVRLKRAGKKGPYCWTALEWVEGVSVKELIDAIGISGMLDWKEVWRIAVHIGQALQKAHEIDIVHRNVSPSNILRRAESQDFLLTDLVLARALENTDHVQLTRPGDLLGELGYMAPERVFDSTCVEARSDQYGLGATLYALLTGQPPHQSLDVAQLMESIRAGSVKSPLEFQMGLDERFCDVVMRMIKPSIHDRFENPTELLKALQNVGSLAGLEAQASPWKD